MKGPINVRPTQKGLQSPYAGWFDPRMLREEADRLAALPRANTIIQRWRRNRIWQIEMRIREIHRGHIT